MRYAIDSKRQELKATGIVNPAMLWEDQPDGKRRPSKTVQDRDENTGMPLWEVEVSYRTVTFGRESTVSSPVLVGAVDRPHPQDDSKITFKFLGVDSRGDKGGGLVERWFAEEIDRMTVAKSALNTNDDAKTAAADASSSTKAA